MLLLTIPQPLLSSHIFSYNYIKTKIDYVDAIFKMLKPGGVWINLGI